jgi:hypothetical protein
VRPLIWLLSAALLAACETAYKDGAPNERSPWFEVPVGSKLVLHRGVEAAAGQGSAYFQDGKLLRWYDVNQYAPYCALGLQAISWEAAQRVTADQFVVRNVSKRPFFTLAAGWRLQPARRDSDSDGMTYEVLATVMELQSAQQPAVRALTCASWGLPQGRPYLTVEQIRRALGAYFTLELKSGSEPE